MNEAEPAPRSWKSAGVYARGYTASNDGNISTRLDAGRLLMTPKNVCKGFMAPDMMVVTDLDGRKIAGDRDLVRDADASRGARQRPDAQAVVHAHPPIATGFAVAGIPPRSRRARRGDIDPRQRRSPTTRRRRRRSCRSRPQSVRAHDGMLLANHGALTLGADLFAAHYKMETIEHFAKISLMARLLGGERLLAAGSGPAAGAAREVRHLGAGADLSAGRRAGGRRPGRPGELPDRLRARFRRRPPGPRSG